MDPPLKSNADSIAIELIPPDFVQRNKENRRALSQKLVILSVSLLVGGLVAYGWFFAEDRRYSIDGVKTTGIITSYQSQTTSSKGNTRTTHTISYNYAADEGTTLTGSDAVKCWRHLPATGSPLNPKSGQPIEVEYLRSNPNTSRINIRNRFDTEYELAINAIVASIVILMIRFINSFPIRLRIQIYGVLFTLGGLAIVAAFLYLLLKMSRDSPAARDMSVYLEVLIFFLFMITPFVIAFIWFGWSMLKRSRRSFEDPREMLNLASMPPLGNRITIFCQRWLGRDDVIILDHQKRWVHFFNCHSIRGFFSRSLDLYSCAIDSIKIVEHVMSTKNGKVPQVHLISKDGRTILGLNKPGVNEFIELLRTPTENPAVSSTRG